MVTKNCLPKVKSLTSLYSSPERRDYTRETRMYPSWSASTRADKNSLLRGGCGNLIRGELSGQERFNLQLTGTNAEREELKW